MITFISFIGRDFKFGHQDCARPYGAFIPGFVISGFCSLHFTVTLTGLWNIVRYTCDFVLTGLFYQGCTVVV